MTDSLDSVELAVRYVELEPTRIATASAVSKSPERDAWEVLSEWADAHGVLRDRTRHMIFGYNDPSLTTGEDERGYTFFVTVEDGEATEGVDVEEFPGGTYAVTRCYGLQNVEETWNALVAWREQSEYESGGDRCLEETITLPGGSPEDAILDLYLPIER